MFEALITLNGLCAVRWTNYLVDAVVLLFLAGYVIVCAKRGFVDCFFTFLSTTIAFIVAVMFAKAILSGTNGLFGLQGVMQNGFTRAFAKISGFDTPVSSEGMEGALADKNIPAIIASLAVKWFGKEDLAASVTLAQVFGGVTANLLCLLLVGVLIFIIVKLLLLFLRKLLNTIVEKISLLGGVNTVLGAIIGVLQGLLIVSVALSVLALIPIPAVTNYLLHCPILGWLYNNNPLVWLLGLFL